MKGAKRRGSKPEPYKWMIRGGQVIEVYDFNYWKRSNPPPDGYETPVICFVNGYYTETGAWVMR